MAPRYRAALALTLALAAWMPAFARVPHRHPVRARRGADRISISAEELYSRRALRRARIILELKLLELRSEHLERVRKAIEKHIPIDQILSDP
jgi:hypothetical protein